MLRFMRTEAEKPPHVAPSTLEIVDLACTCPVPFYPPRAYDHGELQRGLDAKVHGEFQALRSCNKPSSSIC